MQAYRLRKTSGVSRETTPLVAGMVAPFLLGFASWVLAQAQRDGVRRLYFLARDCQMTYQVARKISGHFGGIECRYLRVSRQALLLPTARAISEEGMPWMRRAYETPTLERLLAKLELSYEDVRADWDGRAGAAAGRYPLKDEDDWRNFWEALNREPLLSRLLTLIETRRREAQAYFRTEGLLDSVPWAVVDLGWYLSCQSALGYLLREMNPAAECRGYYLGLRRDRLGPMEAGKAQALFHQGGADFPPGSQKQVLFKHATLFEHVLGMADHPSVHHFENARPAYQSTPITAPVERLTSTVHADVVTFAAQNAALAPTLSDPRVAATILSELMTSFAVKPSAETVRALAALPASEDQNNLHASSIAAPMTGGELATLWIPERLRKFVGRPNRPSVWIEGRLAVTPSYLRRLFDLRKTLTSGGLPRFLPT